MITAKEICLKAPVIPVIVLERLEDAVPAGRALVEGGLPVLEVTLRTPVALSAIRAMAAEIPGAIVGAGSVNTPALLREAKEAGASFAVAPGSTPALLDAAEHEGMPILPGASSPSEVMALLERGLEVMKFFPAEQSGGVGYLKALAGPLPHALFCPTGGITPEKARDYLSLPSVLCVGGSWVLPREAMALGDWAQVKRLAGACHSLTAG